jgi:Cys-tRNA(Pro) deacylase
MGYWQVMKMKPETIPVTMAIRTLKAAKTEFELFAYDYTPHGGTAQCAAELGIDHHATIKTIILEDETKKPFVCLMHGDREISVKNLARARKVKTVVPCAPETADRHSGYHVGGTSPFGTRKRMKVYVESSIFDLPRIYINAGHRGLCAAMSPDVIETVLDDVERVNVAVS